MKNYIKILFITFGIQIAGYICMNLTDYFFRTFSICTVASVYVLGIFIASSMILSIFLSMKWQKTNLAKFVSVILMPTNYTWLIIAIIAVNFLNRILEIMQNLPPNFG